MSWRDNEPARIASYGMRPATDSGWSSKMDIIDKICCVLGGAIFLAAVLVVCVLLGVFA